jgi:hypothetical protein
MVVLRGRELRCTVPLDRLPEWEPRNASCLRAHRKRLPCEWPIRVARTQTKLPQLIPAELVATRCSNSKHEPKRSTEHTGTMNRSRAEPSVVAAYKEVPAARAKHIPGPALS